ncbi:hypothetical protein KR51_00014000 [Rubidibacter lacunae KORDI 51-2]|uniref:Uncharacterized protein n=1 Tax=Rubidibacter lacunae KORDI 51-2 TaxID=582515 RepID=U5DN65_9CHRO|nr:hypothetical protein KR51_00014000 [Rubidibacter lacunae KORDI 51-2]
MRLKGESSVGQEAKGFELEEAIAYRRGERYQRIEHLEPEMVGRHSKPSPLRLIAIGP